MAKNQWLVIVLMSVAAGLFLSYLRDPKIFSGRTNPADHPSIPVAPGKRATIYMPEAVDFTAKALPARAYGLTNELATLLTVANAAAGIDQHPMTVLLARPPVELEALFAALPPKVVERVARRLEAIYFTSGLGAESLTQYLFRSVDALRPYAAFIVVDLTRVRDQLGTKTLDAWMTERENTVFNPSRTDRIEAVVETRPGETWPLELLLLHELGHVLSVNSNAHPSWETDRWYNESEAGYPFMAESWKINGSEIVCRPEADFKDRRSIHYFGQGPLPASKIAEAYEELARAPFTTLRAATNPFDDFAESFMTYVHTVILKKPFELRVIHKGKVARKVGACWDEPRCAAKRAALERFLAQDD